MKILENAYALIIGVGGEKMQATVDDANLIFNVLSDPKLGGYKKENIFLLTEEKATKKGIFDGFDQLIEKSNEDSSVLIYYSGHGGHHAEGGFNIYFLQPFDFTSTNFINAENFRKKISELKSKRLVCLLDCCHAAGMTGTDNRILDAEGNVTGFKDNPEGLAQTLEFGQRNVTIMTSCREDQESYILEGEKNSLFTQCFVEALSGKNRRDFDDEFVRVTEAVNYIFKEVPKRKPIQEPYMNLQLYTDFPLSFLPENMRPFSFLNALTPDSADAIQASGEAEAKSASLFRTSEHAKKLVLFIHGFSGEGHGSFGKTTELLINNEKMADWDLQPLGYTYHHKPELGKEIWAAIHDIDKIVGYLSTSIKYKFNKYEEIAIVAHGLGGIVAQKTILDLKPEFRSKISHLILLATPSDGISEEMMQKDWNAKYSEMRNQGTFIRSLRDKWDNVIGKNPPFTLKVTAATEDEYVNLDSCFANFEEEYCEVVDGNHLGMIKPEDENDDLFNLILFTLTDEAFQNKFTNKEDINLALGKYQAVIDALLPNRDNLDENKLRQLIIALESMGSEEEALDVIESMDLAKNNPALLGVLGEKFKTQYIKGQDEKYAKRASYYFKKALQIASENDNKEQILDFAINLAFISIVAFNKLGHSHRYAKQAVDASKETEINASKWSKLGEAYVYLNDFDKAKEYYSKAARIAPIHEKISIYTKSMISYHAWEKGMHGRKWSPSEEDKMLNFLKKEFLM